MSRVVGSDYSTGQGINFYNVYVDGKAYGQTFCMAPGKSRYVGGHTCQRTITPAKKGSNQAFDVAVTYAYQTMVNEGIIGKNPTSRSRLVGTMVFRWLEYYYGQLEAPTAAYIFKDSLDNRTNASYWRQSNQNVKDAIRISTAAKNLGNKIKNGSKTYEDLVEAGKIWTDEWNFILVNTKVDGNIVTVKFDVTPKVGKAPASVKWKQFDIQCEFGFTCTVKSKKKISANKGRYVVEIDTSKGQTSKTEHQKYGMKVTTAYVDQRNPAAYVMLLNPDVGTRGHQKMFLIKDFVSSYIIQSDIPVDYPNNECLCEEKDGKFTGDYVYYETVDGKTTSTVIKKDDTKVAEEVERKVFPGYVIVKMVMNVIKLNIIKNVYIFVKLLMKMKNINIIVKKKLLIRVVRNVVKVNI